MIRSRDLFIFALPLLMPWKEANHEHKALHLDAEELLGQYPAQVSPLQPKKNGTQGAYYCL